jgi:hypothetical protein
MEILGNVVLTLIVPVLLVIVASLFLRGKHTGSVILAAFVAWVLYIYILTRPYGGELAGVGRFVGAVLFTGPIVSLIGFCVTLVLRISSKWTRHVFDFALLASTVIGASSLAIKVAQRHRVETRELPALVKRIYEAEMSYSTGRPDKAFTCDVTQLPTLGVLAWSVGNASRDGFVREAGSGWSAQYRQQLPYQVRLRCWGGATPQVFRVDAWYENNNRLLRFFSDCPCATVKIAINQTGELEVGDPW